MKDLTRRICAAAAALTAGSSQNRVDRLVPEGDTGQDFKSWRQWV